jgi:hypothetical protein
MIFVAHRVLRVMTLLRADVRVAKPEDVLFDAPTVSAATSRLGVDRWTDGLLSLGFRSTLVPEAVEWTPESIS